MRSPDNDMETEVALFRYDAIMEAVHASPEEAMQHLKRQSEREMKAPGSGRRSKVAFSTLRSWLRSYRRAGLDGLKPQPRRDRGTTRRIPQEVAEALISTRREHMDLSVRQVIGRVLKSGIVPEGMPLAPTTVYRLLRREGLMPTGGRRRKPVKDLRRFAFEHAGELWQSDVMHGPKVRDRHGRKRKTYLLALLDDATRLVPYARFAFRETAAEYLLVLKEAVQLRGCPARIFADYVARNIIGVMLRVSLCCESPATP